MQHADQVTRQRRRRGAARSTAAALTCAAVAYGLAACEPSQETGLVEPATPGRVLYLAHCRGCHGAAADGNGEAAPYLETRPADLTRLWQSYGSPLDRERLAAVVDGRGPRRVHGPRSMPVWGDEFFSEARPEMANLEETRAGLIAALIDYLQTFQTDASAQPEPSSAEPAAPDEETARNTARELPRID